MAVLLVFLHISKSATTVQESQLHSSEMVCINVCDKNLLHNANINNYNSHINQAPTIASPGHYDSQTTKVFSNFERKRKYWILVL